MGELSAEEFNELLYASSSTPPEERNRCPNTDCHSVEIKRTDVGVTGPDAEAKYRCTECRHAFDEPVKLATDGGVDLDDLRRQPSTTPRDEQERCPKCGSVKVKKKVDDYRGTRQNDADYLCDNCYHHFDDPVDPPRIVTDGGSVQDEDGAAQSVDDTYRKCVRCGTPTTSRKYAELPVCWDCKLNPDRTVDTEIDRAGDGGQA